MVSSLAAGAAALDLASSFLPQAIKLAATVAARAMRPSVRLLIMGLSPLLMVCSVAEVLLRTANGLETKKPTK